MLVVDETLKQTTVMRRHLFQEIASRAIKLLRKLLRDRHRAIDDHPWIATLFACARM